ncbi:MAG: hypothetical protein AAFY27_11805 [Pseudomonadota bacterium]
MIIFMFNSSWAVVPNVFPKSRSPAERLEIGMAGARATETLAGWREFKSTASTPGFSSVNLNAG